MGFGPFFVWGARNDASMAALEAVMEPAVAGLGYELIDVQASNGGRLLRLFIDKPGGVDLGDCAAVSRHLTRLLAVGGGDYGRLGGASPGLGRALRKAGGFARFSGDKGDVGMASPDAGGRRRV